MPPRTTIWPMDAQTMGKHLVLREYLNAWIPILGQRRGRIVFIDGFAGPGKYTGGEDGSPVIALKALTEHAMAPRISAAVTCIFIEDDPKRYESLREVVAGHALPASPRISTSVKHGKFDAHMTEVLDSLDAQDARMAPAFVMIDPFGMSDTPMAVIERIFRHPSSEVFVSLMAPFIARFATVEEPEPHLDELFGCPDWREARQLEGLDARKEFFYQLYDRRLRESGAKYVLHFELYRGNQLVYAIFFATKEDKGCEKMKDAMWKVMPEGNFLFRGSRTGQESLVFTETNLPRLRVELRDAFGDRWVPIEEIETFMRSDRTLFRVGHLKEKTLKPMEAQRLLEVRPAPGRRSGTFPPGTVLRFLSA